MPVYSSICVTCVDCDRFAYPVSEDSSCRSATNFCDASSHSNSVRICSVEVQTPGGTTSTVSSQFESVQLKFKPPGCATSKVSSTLHLRRGCTTLVRTEIVTWFFLLVRMRRGSVSRATLLAFEPRENSVNKGARAARIRPRLPHCQQGQAHSLEFGLLSTYANCND